MEPEATAWAVHARVAASYRGEFGEPPPIVSDPYSRAALRAHLGALQREQSDEAAAEYAEALQLGPDRQPIRRRGWARDAAGEVSEEASLRAASKRAALRMQFEALRRDLLDSDAPVAASAAPQPQSTSQPRPQGAPPRERPGELERRGGGVDDWRARHAAALYADASWAAALEPSGGALGHVGEAAAAACSGPRRAWPSSAPAPARGYTAQPLAAWGAAGLCPPGAAVAPLPSAATGWLEMGLPRACGVGGADYPIPALHGGGVGEAEGGAQYAAPPVLAPAPVPVGWTAAGAWGGGTRGAACAQGSHAPTDAAAAAGLCSRHAALSAPAPGFAPGFAPAHAAAVPGMSAARAQLAAAAEAARRSARRAAGTLRWDLSRGRRPPLGPPRLSAGHRPHPPDDRTSDRGGAAN